MKKRFHFRLWWLGLLGWVAVIGSLRAQVPDAGAAPLPVTLLKTAPVHFEEVNAAVERFYGANYSLQYGAGYIYRSMVNAGAFGEPVGRPVNGLSGRLAYRRYWGSRFAAPQGGYHGPLATYRYLTYPNRVYYDQFNRPQSLKLRQQVFSVQYLLGMQRIFKGWLVVDAFAGLGVRLKFATRKDTGAEPGIDMGQGQFYGRKLAASPDWILLAGPSVSLNLAVGVVL